MEGKEEILYIDPDFPAIIRTGDLNADYFH